MHDSAETDRRGFYQVAIYGLLSIIAAALSIPAAIYLLLPPRASRKNEWVDAGDLTQIQPMQPVEIVFRRNRTDGWKVSSEKSNAWVVKSSDGVVAFAPQCTHLGCAYHWDENRHNFICPCHASAFSIDGRVLSGPAPRPLDRYDVKIEGNRILLGAVRKAI
jgi:menaquinol-cytochrome c reductase iron-sulfur subunit